MNQETPLSGLDAWLGLLFDDDSFDETCANLAGTSGLDPEADKRETRLRAAIPDCDCQIRNYRQLLVNEDRVALVAQWIAGPSGSARLSNDSAVSTSLAVS